MQHFAAIGPEIHFSSKNYLKNHSKRIKGGRSGDITCPKDALGTTKSSAYKASIFFFFLPTLKYFNTNAETKGKITRPKKISIAKNQLIFSERCIKNKI